MASTIALQGSTWLSSSSSSSSYSSCSCRQWECSFFSSSSSLRRVEPLTRTWMREMPKSASIVTFALADKFQPRFPRDQQHKGDFALRHDEGRFGILFRGTKKNRSMEVRVIPFQRGDARQQPPPDLPSYLFKNRIIFLGMSLVPAVTELIMAELLYLQYDDPSKPVYMYINSTGTTKDGEKLGYDTEAFAIYDTMSYVKPPIFTLCVGNAWGEAALLLSAGAKGNRSALPSSTIMIKQPIAQFRGQATDIDIARREVRNVKNELVALLSKHTGHSKEKIEEDIRRPKYFSPEEAVEYGIIDKILYSEKGKEEKGVVADLRKAQLL